jgi:lipopolysaccharide biosynthesis glycosyltransferase
MVVACAANERYVMPLAVMLTSLVDHLDPKRQLSIHVVDGGIPPVEREQVGASLRGANVSIEWIPAKSSRPDLPTWGRLDPAVYQRLMLPGMLPESVHRAIWLDCDLVIRQDLGRLWDVDLADRHVLAVQDIIVPYVSSFMGVAHHADLGIPADGKYFNAGVMVMNLPLWRDHDVLGQVVTYLDEYRDDVVFLEQEALNAVLASKWGELDPRWNQNASVAGQPFFRPRHLDARTYERLVSDPWIVHFNGRIKPWSTRKPSPSRRLYQHYLDATPWAGWRPPRSVAGFLLGAYESSLPRRILYPTEKWAVEGMRRLTRKRSRGAAASGKLVPSPRPERITKGLS